MSESHARRTVSARRVLTLTTAAALTVSGSAEAGFEDARTAKELPMLLASGEGEGGQATSAGSGGEGGEGGEGGGGGPSGQAFQRDLSFMEGHLRAGLALYQTGDLAAAKTHMGHPIKEKYCQSMFRRME